MPDYTIADEVAQYYARGGETTRLTADGQGRLEFIRTQDILRRLITTPRATILDVGGGTGVHARWLSADGHDVTLVDPITVHTRTAADTLPDITVGAADARNLPFADAGFDVVLLLGPLYHLQTAADRHQALQQARRVTRPGGLIVAAAISRFTPWLDAIRTQVLGDKRHQQLLTEVHRTGQLRPHHHGTEGFTTAYVHHPDQLRAELTAAAIDDVTLYAVEGTAWLFDTLAQQLDDPDISTNLLNGLRDTEQEPTTLGTSAHLLAAGRRPQHPDSA